MLDSLSRAKRKVSFVQIGAHDGKRWDLIHDFIKRDGWSGLFVEPLPKYFEALQENYRGRPGLRFERAAIADLDGAIPIYFLDTLGLEVPEWLEGTATFSREVLMQHAHVHPDFERRIRSETVPALRLSTLLAKHQIEAATLFLIDTEGYDYFVVRQVLDLAWAPEMIIYEHSLLRPEHRAELERELQQRGYTLQSSECDTIASKVHYQRLRLTDFLPFGFLKA